MRYQISAYIKYLSRSTNQHGVHSPFVFDLVTQCFYDKKKYPQYATLTKHRKALLKNKDTIEVVDFGAGSRVFKGNNRLVSKIAKNAGIAPKRQRLLFRLVQYFNSKEVLELGTSVGLGTIALALGNNNANIQTVEGCPNTSKVAQSYFDRFNTTNIQLHTQTFPSFFESPTTSFDLVYIDGNHSKESTLSYFHALLNHVHNDTVLIFDDIYWSPDMTSAWNEIILHEKVTVSIDTFQWGLVFFRKEQSKQHFTIRL